MMWRALFADIKGSYAEIDWISCGNIEGSFADLDFFFCGCAGLFCGYGRLF